MLYAFGVGEVPISVSGDPSNGGPLLHTVRAVGSVTEAICRCDPGDQLGVRGPYGSSWPVDEAAGGDVVIVAGGIGLAPLRPVVHHLLAHRERYGRVVVLYGGRSPEELLYTAELERWRGRFDVEVEVTVDSAGGDWSGDVGVVTRLIDRAEFDPPRAVAMVCGPEVMMRFAVGRLRERGVAAERDLRLDRAQHEVRGRPLRALPVRPHLRLQGRAGDALRDVEPLLAVREL